MFLENIQTLFYHQTYQIRTGQEFVTVQPCKHNFLRICFHNVLLSIRIERFHSNEGFNILLKAL
jgi:hypothetical protein